MQMIWWSIMANVSYVLFIVKWFIWSIAVLLDLLEFLAKSNQSTICILSLILRGHHRLLADDAWQIARTYREKLAKARPSTNNDDEDGEKNFQSYDHTHQKRGTHNENHSSFLWLTDGCRKRNKSCLRISDALWTMARTFLIDKDVITNRLKTLTTNWFAFTFLSDQCTTSERDHIHCIIDSRFCFQFIINE